MDIRVESKYLQYNGVCAQWHKIINAWWNSKVTPNNIEKGVGKRFAFWELNYDVTFRHIHNG